MIKLADGEIIGIRAACVVIENGGILDFREAKNWNSRRVALFMPDTWVEVSGPRGHHLSRHDGDKVTVPMTHTQCPSCAHIFMFDPNADALPDPQPEEEKAKSESISEIPADA